MVTLDFIVAKLATYLIKHVGTSTLNMNKTTANLRSYDQKR